MSKPSLLRFLRQWFVILTVALTAIGCGGRSDEGLMTPDDASADAANRGDAQDGGLIVLPDGAVILPDGALTDISVPPSDGSADGVVTLPDGRVVDTGTVGPGDGGGSLDGGTTAMLTRITIDPPVATLGIATTQPLKVTGVYSDGTTRDITQQGVTFSSNSAATATVTTTGGLVTAVSAGMATITATRQPEMLTATSQITVSAATVMSIAVTPTTQTIGVGGSVPYIATATMSDGSHQDVTSSVNWTSTDAAVASISSMAPTAGVARGLAAGMTTIRATMMVGGVSGSATLTVTASPLVSIAITPPNPILPIGVSFTFKATGTYANGMTGDVTNSVVWSSGTPAVGTIGAATGVGNTIAAGTSVITASLTEAGMTITGTTNLTVTPAKLVSIAVTPAMSNIIVGLKAQLTATGRFDNNTNLDITASASWSSSNASAAFVSTAAGTAGQVSGLAAGMATITASLSGINGTATVTVVEAKLVSIAISPAMPSVPLGATIPVTANGTYDNGLMADVTALVTWSTDAAATATISNAQGTNGQVTGRAIGMTNVRAVSGTITASVPLTVTAAVPTSIEITPANPSVQVTRTQQMLASAVYTDGSRVDVTTQAAWTTGRAATATISNGAGTQGTVTAVAVGTTTITATWSGLMGTTNLTVTPAIPTGITVTPFEVAINVNATQAYTAVVIYDIGTQATVTGQCMWTSSNTSVATIAIGGMGMGMTATARGLGYGETTITCKYTAQGVTVTGTATLKVNPPLVPTALNITPDPNSCTVGGMAPAFVATATWSNGTTTTVTNTATWTTADAAIAGVSTTGMTRGVATCLNTGMTTVTATFNNSGVTVTGTATLNVDGTPTGVTISAAAQNMTVGQNQNYTTAVLFTVGPPRTIAANSTEMLCVSSNPAIATLQVMGNTRTGACVDVGMVTFTCTYTPAGSTTSVTGSTTLECQDQIPTSIAIAPTTDTLAQGQTRDFTATAIFPGVMNPTDVTANAATTWSTDLPSVLSINTIAPNKGRATAMSPGMAIVTVSFRGVTATAMVTVGPLAPLSLTVTPSTGTLNGTSQQYLALLNMSDGTSPDVTANCNWTLTAIGDGGTGGLTISNTGATKGLVTIPTGTPVGTQVTLTVTYTGTAGSVPPVTRTLTVQ